MLNWLKNLRQRLFKRKKRKVKPRAKKSSAKSGGRRRKKLSLPRRIWQWLWLRLRKLILAGGFIFILWFAWVWLSLPSIDDLDKISKAPGITIRDEAGEIIASYGDVYGDYVPFDQLPKSLIAAVVATEDRNFYRHFGIDPMGLARAMWVNFRAGKLMQGGSTVTQQVAKNVFLSPERTVDRKIREAMLAIKLEARFSKEQIMSIYLNRVYLGAGNFGVEAASRRYFGKSSRKLTLAESAILTGLLKAPSRYAPTSSPKRARGRAEQILINMEDAGFINASTRKKSTAELNDILAKKTPDSSNSYYFTDWIVDDIPSYIGEVTEDIEVFTTYSSRMQHLAEQAVAKVMDARGEEKHATQAALLAMTPDGAVKAVMGGRHYSESQYNRATQSKRQPGSSFKMLVYVNALEQGAWPDMMVNDAEIKIGKWQPQNYTGRHEGLITLRDAVAQSINSVAVLMSETYGRRNVIAMARSLGIVSDLAATPSLALGAYEVSLLELTTAYAHLASGGNSVHPHGIRRIQTKRGKTLYERSKTAPVRVLSADVVGMANDVFSAVMQYGTGRGAAIGRPAAGKTGTTSDYRDAWFIGYTPDIAVGVWVGNDTPDPMKKVTGGSLPAQIWREFTAPALAGTPAHTLPLAERRNEENTSLPWQEDILGKSFWDKLGVGE